MVVEDALRYYEGTVVISSCSLAIQTMMVRRFYPVKKHISPCSRYPQWWRYSAAWRLWSLGVKGELCRCVQLSAMGAPRSHPDSRWHQEVWSGYVGYFAWSYKCRIFLRFAATHALLGGMYWSAALVKVPSIGFAAVRDTQPATPVSVTVQVCQSTIWLLSAPFRWQLNFTLMRQPQGKLWWSWSTRPVGFQLR